MAWDWRILRGRAERLRARYGKPLEGLSVLLIQHVLPDLVPLVEQILELGCDPPDVQVVGVPYSSLEAPALAIQRLGCRVELPATFPMDGVVAACLLEATQRCVGRGKRLILLEDGGYAVPLASQLLDSGRIAADVILGAVEQTSRGSRIDRAFQRAGQLRVPVISVPDCLTKTEVEPPYIAEAVVRNLTLMFSTVSSGTTPRLATVGMFGFGTVGNHVARSYKARGSNVLVSEARPQMRQKHLSLGFEDLTELRIGQCDLVLGLTGSRSMGPPVLDRLKDGVYVASASSQQIEIDVEHLYTRQRESTAIPPIAGCVMRIPTARRFLTVDSNGERSITVLYDGYPLNFWGTSLPDRTGDAILSLLLEGVVAVSTGLFRSPVVFPGNEAIEQADLEIFLLFNVLSRLNPDGIYVPQ